MKNIFTESYCTPKQLKMPIDIEILIDIDDPVHSFFLLLAFSDYRAGLEAAMFLAHLASAFSP